VLKGKICKIKIKHCSIPTLNAALVFTLMIHGDLTSSNLERKKSLAIGNTKLNTIPFLDRRIIYKAKMTARPMQFKKGKLDIVKHKL
jgi:hypothetical protein